MDEDTGIWRREEDEEGCTRIQEYSMEEDEGGWMMMAEDDKEE